MHILYSVFICHLYSGRHVSIRADHRLGLLYMNIFRIFIPYI
jgi:hypothetical protein